VSVRLGWTPDDKLRFACAYRLVAGLSWKCNVGEPVGGPNSRSAIRRRWPEVPGVDAWRAMELGQGRSNRRFAPGVLSEGVVETRIPASSGLGGRPCTSGWTPAPSRKLGCSLKLSRNGTN